MILRRTPVTLEQRQRRQRFMREVRQISLVAGIATALAIGILAAVQS